MTTKSTFSDLIKEAMTHTPPRTGYWKIYKLRLWRLCGSKAYKGRRDEILARYKEIRRKRGTARLTDFITKDFILLKLLGEKDLAPQVFKFNGGLEP